MIEILENIKKKKKICFQFENLENIKKKNTVGGRRKLLDVFVIVFNFLYNFFK